MKTHVRAVINWITNADLVVLLTAFIVVASIWIFIVVAYLVREGNTQSFDENLIRAMRDAEHPEQPIGPRWLGEMGRDITALGGYTVLTLVTMAVVGFLWIRRTHHAVALVVLATLGGLLISSLLKSAFGRPRPSVVPHLSYVEFSSFPSGHSMLSAVVYLTLGSMVARLVERRRLKIYCLSVAMLLTFLVGVSRVYMGVHYPTDVLAGWSAGLAWAFLCALVARNLQERHMVESHLDDPAEP